MYVFKTPGFFKKIWPRYPWEIDTKEKILYLTFDDGPHPVATPFVLDQLAQYNAKATFFCIGKNVVEHPSVYQRLLNEGHAVGNHTHNHFNGWKTATPDYIKNVEEASKHIQSGLFRPPYGRIKTKQGKIISRHRHIIMWTVLTGDFDTSQSWEYCNKKVLGASKQGSILVFHDSEKAFPILEKLLPSVLSYFHEKGYRFEKLTAELVQGGRE